MTDFNETALRAIIADIQALSDDARQPFDEKLPGSHHPEIGAIMSRFHEMGFFDNISWHDDLAEVHMSAPDDVDALAGASITKLRALMLAHNRLERYAPGHLQELSAIGYFQKWADALESALD
ncbi:MAG: hypothetical protein AAFX02_09450 [Pseudomonadota bacterium]